ncbi:Protein fem-1-like protein [Cryptotermes secundus]|uniref:Protein fem-1-like protein n=1 Tax=Cryptotermes secundus TaxID=105785 RepID=A0A2J7QXE9_9NEOP|nr:protein fem-1 homolog CG6966 isoform X2 [Cryptotermes secundus]PNF33258.1 Protein fem-1-like protein [Cryptotermes secundus]
MMQEMDFKNVIYNAARDGKLRRLKVFLDHRTKEEVLMLVAAKTNGATPLVMACRNGHYDVAEYLIEHCKADIEQLGSVVFDGDTIEGAPPLWCAAAAGHLPVVRLLVRNGASVNSTTRTNSTPLRAACFDGHFEIVKFLVDHGADIEVANRHGHTCLMIACYKGHFRIARFLLGLDANVNRKSVKGNTALHDCAESGSLEILKLLIEHGAKMDVDSYGMTPLLAASVTGHTHIVEYLIKLPDLVSRTERVDALELLGATYVDKKRDMIGALELWKRAMDDRYPIGSTHLPKPNQRNTVAAYDHAREIRDLEGLEDLLADPDEMRMQALVIRERILGPAHPDTSYYIRYRGAVYADAGKFNRCVALWNYALDMQQSMLEPLNPMTQSSLFSFTELFSFMMGEQGRPSTRGRRVPPAAFTDLMTVFKKSVREVEAGVEMLDKIPGGERDATYLHRVLVISLHLACLLTRLLPDVSSEQRHKVHCFMYRLVKQDVHTRLGCTALHLACSIDAALVGRYPACQFPSSHLVDVLLTVGADVDSRDETGNMPLHLAAMSKPCPPALVRKLLDHGAHLDAVNSAGHTFPQLLKGQAIHEIVNPLKYTTLSCLAARVIVKHNIPYKGIIPVTLEPFVEQH